MASLSKIPHTLRVALLLLRLVIGLDFFYFGFAVLFDPALGASLREESFGNFYSWLAAPASAGWIHPFAQWAILLIGACLVIGLAVRLASAVGIGLLLFSFLPGVTFAAPDLSQFINNEVILMLCLLILFIANAGTWFGLDTFVHLSLRRHSTD